MNQRVQHYLSCGFFGEVTDNLRSNNMTFESGYCSGKDKIKYEKPPMLAHLLLHTDEIILDCPLSVAMG